MQMLHQLNKFQQHVVNDVYPSKGWSQNTGSTLLVCYMITWRTMDNKEVCGHAQTYQLLLYLYQKVLMGALP